MHGTSDWRVSAPSVLPLVQKLTLLKHPMRFILYEGGTHALGKVGPTRDANIWEWMDKYVRDKEALPSMELGGK